MEEWEECYYVTVKDMDVDQICFEKYEEAIKFAQKAQLLLDSVLWRDVPMSIKNEKGNEIILQD